MIKTNTSIPTENHRESLISNQKKPNAARHKTRLKSLSRFILYINDTQYKDQMIDIVKEHLPGIA